MKTYFKKICTQCKKKETYYPICTPCRAINDHKSPYKELTGKNAQIVKRF